MNENLDYDFFLLQEMHSSCKTQADLIEKCFKGQCFWSIGIGKSAGIAIFVSPKFSGKIIRYVYDTDGRILSLLVDLNSFKFNIICLYAPITVSDRKLFFSHLHTFFLSPGNLILGGDFNCIDSDLDRLHIKSDFSADKRCLSALKSDFCLVDIFRKQNPKAISFTWSNKDFSQASRLARCVAPIARGGLNIVNFETKCLSLRFSSLSGYREGFRTCKWHFLARYCFGNPFTNLDPSFDFSFRSIPVF